MHLPMPEPVADSAQQRARDRRRLQRALNASLAGVLVLVAVFSAQPAFDWAALAIAPHMAAGLVGIVTAPLLHGSLEHLGANAVALLLLGTLAGTVYPRATLRALPLVWIGSGLAAWALGDSGTRHLGASGIAHGLMFLVFTLGLLRRDRPAIAAAMVVFFLYGGMLLTVLPHAIGVSWQAHLGGALAGIVAAWIWRNRDPRAPRRRYSWEDDPSADPAIDGNPNDGGADDALEPPRPDTVPVLWTRDATPPERVVLPFPRKH
jgi:membrane associated rhomboid family serine protease